MPASEGQNEERRQAPEPAPLPSPTIQPSHLRPATRHDDQLSELFGPVKGFAAGSFEAGFDAAIESRVVGANLYDSAPFDAAAYSAGFAEANRLVGEVAQQAQAAA
jgi:hypothetical protein